MRTETGIQNFISFLHLTGKRSAKSARRGILYFLILAVLVAGKGERSVLLRETAGVCPCRPEAVWEAPSLSQPVDMWSEQVSQSRPAAVTNIVRAVRTGFSCRFGILFFLHFLTVLSVLGKCFAHFLALHDSRRIYREYFTISYMQDTDGRKRIPLILR